MNTTRLYATLLLCGVTALTAGCGSGVERGTVRGTVSFKNERVTSGTVQLYTDTNEIYSCLIGEDGTYQIANVPAGEVRVAVITHGAVPPGLQVRPPARHPAYPGAEERTPPRKHLAIPDRYASPTSSGLSVAVANGEQSFDIQMKP